MDDETFRQLFGDSSMLGQNQDATLTTPAQDAPLIPQPEFASEPGALPALPVLTEDYQHSITHSVSHAHHVPFTAHPLPSSAYQSPSMAVPSPMPSSIHTAHHTPTTSSGTPFMPTPSSSASPATTYTSTPSISADQNLPPAVRALYQMFDGQTSVLPEDSQRRWTRLLVTLREFELKNGYPMMVCSRLMLKLLYVSC
jgi:hypothetical protein